MYTAYVTINMIVLHVVYDVDTRWHYTASVHLVLAKESSSKTVAWKARRTPQAAESPTKKITQIHTNSIYDRDWQGMTFCAFCGLSPFLLEGKHGPPCSTRRIACTLLKLGFNHVEIVNFKPIKTYMLQNCIRYSYISVFWLSSRRASSM